MDKHIGRSRKWVNDDDEDDDDGDYDDGDDSDHDGVGNRSMTTMMMMMMVTTMMVMTAIMTEFSTLTVTRLWTIPPPERVKGRGKCPPRSTLLLTLLLDLL